MRDDDEQAFRRYSQELADAIDSRIEDWVERSVLQRCLSAGIQPTPAIEGLLADARRECRDYVSHQLDALIHSDIDDQRTTPLAIIRTSTRYAARVLNAAGVAAVERDEFEQRSFPDDVYGLMPASMADVHESLVEPALVWGAAKAHIHRSRHL